MQALPFGRGEIRRQGQGGAMLVFGTPLAAALKAAKALDLTVANMRFVKPLDEALVVELAQQHDWLVTVEENAVMGGAGSAVLECLAAKGIAKPVLQIGLPDRFVEHGEQAELWSECGLDAAGIESAVRARFRPS